MGIPASEDPSCRYKMPALQTQVRGSGKMVRTIIPNIKDVAEALCCSQPRMGKERILFVSTPESILRFFSLSLGTDGDLDTNSLGGSWTASKLQELQLHFDDSATICGRCQACAWQGGLSLPRNQSQRLIEQMFKMFKKSESR